MKHQHQNHLRLVQPAGKDEPAAESQTDRFTRRAMGADDPDSIPEPVLEAMRRSSELADDLLVDGLRIRYEINSLTGRVCVSLCDLGENVVRVVPLRAALGAEDDTVPAA